ncbi:MULTISPECIES: hypothetical protein [Alishewanella]|uniref:Uncharacterized protein n=1 Tax=Alishewanella aestuarii B11 TaxID=1197174 RepID=J1QG20_9ALTE|nr:MULTISPECIES: hypothetical protein [Alishewanella]EJI84451.1 hypothetical protein AEST_27220 [Alishewanella aestuarii B11]MCT8125227.1 hypothetical protein [Alishewanella sp. BS5-314]OCW98055.1 hypothetical protein A9165_03180 [Alishewanella sp. HH-ZS]
MLAIQVQERRQTEKDLNYFWDQLSLAQKFSVAELQRYGYQLQFVRHLPYGKLAVLDFDGKLAAIDQEGQIDTAPDIVLRG